MLALLAAATRWPVCDPRPIDRQRSTRFRGFPDVLAATRNLFLFALGQMAPSPRLANPVTSPPAGLELPRLYATVLGASAQARRSLFRNNGLQLSLLFVTALLAGLHMRVSVTGHPLDLGPILSLLAFMGAMYLRLITLEQQKQQSWMDGRASASVVASISWRYAVGVTPFEKTLPPDQADARLLSALKDVITNISQNEFVELVVPTVGIDQITTSMREVRDKDLTGRIAAYREARLVDRAHTFAAHAERNRIRNRWWYAASIALLAFGVVGASMRLMGLMDWDTLGIAAAGTAGIAAWLQLRQYRRLAKDYNIATERSALLANELRGIRSEEQWNAFVLSVEGALGISQSRGPEHGEHATPAVVSTPPVRSPRVYFVAPTRSHSEYYSRLHLKMEIDLEKHGFDWRLLSPEETKGVAGMYEALWPALENAERNDAVVFVPKDLAKPQLLHLFGLALGRTQARRVVFLDQQPPAGLRDHPKVAMVGPDNRRVGILGAAALYSKLRNAEAPQYCVLEGPGGVARADGFVEGIRALAAEPIRTRIPDVDRFDNLEPIKQILLRGLPKGSGNLGIFTGNDETAIVVESLLEEMPEIYQRTVIASCDRLREMMFKIRGGKSKIVATVHTDVDQQALGVRHAIEDGVNLLVVPDLYPPDAEFESVIADSRFVALWNRAS